MKLRKPLSFKYRLFAGSLVVALIPLLLCSLTMGRLFNEMLVRQTAALGEEQAGELAGRLSAVLQDCEAALAQAAGEPTLQRALVDRNDDSLRKDAYLLLYEAAGEVRTQVGLSLYDAGGYLQFTTRDGSQDERLPVNWGVLRKAARAGDTRYLAQPSGAEDSRDEVCLRLARPVDSSTGMRIGYAECSITIAQMRQLFAGAFEEGATVYLLTPQGRLLCTNGADGGEDAQAIRQAMMEGGMPDDDGLFFFQEEPASGCLLVLRRAVPLSSRAIGLMRTILLAAAVLCVILCVLVSLALSRSLFSPIARLSGAMRRVHAGDLAARVPVGRRDEIGQLTEDFNTMTGQLQTYVAEQVQHQKDLNEAQIRQMQAQLNPHFLYNTLDTIKWLAKIHKLPQVAQLAGNLAGILRCSIASEQFITLRQELDLLQRYIDIQKIRFAGRFNYVLDVPDRLLDCVVPKLILQPLVENAILHGLNARDSGTVYIYAHSEGETLTIAVTDDGCGMPPEMVARINSPEPKILEGHLGLYNISCILKLYYGGAYGLRATSYADVGTTVTIRLPARKEEPHA